MNWTYWSRVKTHQLFRAHKHMLKVKRAQKSFTLQQSMSSKSSVFCWIRPCVYCGTDGLINMLLKFWGKGEYFDMGMPPKMVKIGDKITFTWQTITKRENWPKQKCHPFSDGSWKTIYISWVVQGHVKGLSKTWTVPAVSFRAKIYRIKSKCCSKLCLLPEAKM